MARSILILVALVAVAVAGITMASTPGGGTDEATDAAPAVTPAEPAGEDVGADPDGAADETPDPIQVDADVDEPSTVAGPFALDVSKLTAEEKNRTIVLADGSRVWALNGCVDTEMLAWSADRTRAPIIGIKHGPKFDAYEHADGSQTTTYDVQMPNGTWGAAGIFMRPVPMEGKPLISSPRSESNRLPTMQRPLPPRRDDR